MSEANEERHYIFDNYADAFDAWCKLTLEQQETISPPRQATPNLWIFDKE